MFSSIRRQSQVTLFRRVARLHTTSLPTSTNATAAGLIRIANSTPKTTLRNEFPKINAHARFFSIIPSHGRPSAFAVNEEPDVEFERPATRDMPLSKFQDLLDQNLIHPSIMKAIIEDMKFENMTEVQSKTIRETLKGADVLAQAKTGTGKTLAFLLPVLQKLITGKNPIQRHVQGRPLDIRSIIISPTRELAQQIAREAEVLTQHVPHIKVCTAVGGQGKANALRNMHRSGCNILIATPGRLYDLLTDAQSGVSGRNVEILVLDEADNLLDQGFAEALMSIIRLLPGTAERQTLLFSATVPTKVQSMIQAALKPKHTVLKMVPKGDVPTHTKVEQRIIYTAGFENMLPTLYEQMMQEISINPSSRAQSGDKAETKPFKAIVFFPTTKFAALAAQTFNAMKDPTSGRNPFHPTRIIEIHSRLTQAARERAARIFRESTSAIMFSSDVVARGMDFPDVTHVFQVGPPRTLEQYIHRVGRTARGTVTTGLGYLFLSDLEKRNTLRDLQPAVQFKEWTSESAVARIDMSKETVLPKPAAEALMRTMEASQTLDDSLKKSAYQANIGYYAYLGDKRGLISALNRWAQLGWGMQTPPKVSSMLAKKLGLSGIEGVNIGNDEFSPSGRGGFGGSRGGFSSGSRGGSRGGFGEREPPRESFGERESFGDREGSRGGFGGGRGGFGGSRGGSRGGFGGSSDRPPRRDFGAPRGESFGGRPRESGSFRGASSYNSRRGYKSAANGEEDFPEDAVNVDSLPADGGVKITRAVEQDSRAPREGGFRPKEGGFRPRDGGFAPRDGGFKPRGGGYAARDGGYKPRGEYTPREGGFTPREPREGGFKPRNEGFTPRDGGYKPREGYTPRDGGFTPREPREGGFRPRDGGFAPREGGYKPRTEGYAPRDGGYTPRQPREGGYTPREPREGGYTPREPREGGYTPREPREGGYTPRESREGGFRPRSEGFAPRDGGYKPRNEGFAPREGGYKPREGYTPREGSFKPKSDGGREGRPWEARGRMGSSNGEKKH